jgi:hypothetical protein
MSGDIFFILLRYVNMLFYRAKMVYCVLKLLFADFLSINSEVGVVGMFLVGGSPPKPDPNLRGSITKVKEIEEHKKQVIDRSVDENEKSVVVIYQELVRQYALLMDAHDNLKDKANGLMISNATTINLVTIVTLQLLTSVSYKFSLFLVLIPYVFFISSLYLGVESYLVQDLKTIQAEKLRKDYYNEPKSVILEQLSSNIAMDIKNNRKKAATRSKKINRSIHLFKIGIITFITIFLIIITTNQ